VPRYQLSRTAVKEVADIIGYLHSEAGHTVANKTEKRLFAAFSDLAEGRAFGHRRTDLTDRNVLFHFADPYQIIFRMTRQITYVVHVIHGSRDLKRILH